MPRFALCSIQSERVEVGRENERGKIYRKRKRERARAKFHHHFWCKRWRARGASKGSRSQLKRKFLEGTKRCLHSEFSRQTDEKKHFGTLCALGKKECFCYDASEVQTMRSANVDALLVFFGANMFFVHAPLSRSLFRPMASSYCITRNQPTAIVSARTFFSSVR